MLKTIVMRKTIITFKTIIMPKLKIIIMLKTKTTIMVKIIITTINILIKLLEIAMVDKFININITKFNKPIICKIQGKDMLGVVKFS